jgi:PadR family transcriptional regulator AphA
MVPAHEPALTLSEWIVLSLICEGRTHGNAVTQQLARSGEVGRIWSVPRAMVYRSISRLTDFGLICSAGEEPTSQGPVRQLVEATDEGRVMAAAWQHRPAQHTRDIRSELLVKLALLDRSGVDPHDLLTAQRVLLAPIADALQDQVASAAGFDRTLMLWRYETATATLHFLDALVTAPP